MPGAFSNPTEAWLAAGDAPVRDDGSRTIYHQEPPASLGSTAWFTNAIDNVRGAIGAVVFVLPVVVVIGAVGVALVPAVYLLGVVVAPIAKGGAGARLARILDREIDSVGLVLGSISFGLWIACGIVALGPFVEHLGGTSRGRGTALLLAAAGAYLVSLGAPLVAGAITKRWLSAMIILVALMLALPAALLMYVKAIL